jgi:hypothetical protein
MVISALQITTGGLGFQYFLELNSPAIFVVVQNNLQFQEN